MEFKAGDKVIIIDKEQRFYTGMYNLPTCNGIVVESRKGITEVKFSRLLPVVILTRDLRCDTKNQQLEFAFML